MLISVDIFRSKAANYQHSDQTTVPSRYTMAVRIQGIRFMGRNPRDLVWRQDPGAIVQGQDPGALVQWQDPGAMVQGQDPGAPFRGNIADVRFCGTF